MAGTHRLKPDTGIRDCRLQQECHPIRSFHNSVAFLTGAAGGIGLGMAHAFATQGIKLALADVDADRLADVQRQFKAAGHDVLVFALDVGNRTALKQAVAQVVDALGQLDILVNNAAFQLHTIDFEDLTEEHFDRTLKTNLYGYFHMAQAAVPHLGEGSSIINTGSVTGLLGNKDLLDYSLTKGGIHAFTRSLATHLVPKGIRVNAVAPGPVWTPLNPADKKVEDVAQFGSKTPLKRPAQPEEIAPAYVFLASPQCSSYITGEILPIVGGYNGA